MGLGWTYSSPACCAVIERQLKDAVTGLDVMAVPKAHEAMVRSCRNLGRPGIVSSAISAVDIALWDCKARLLDVAVADLIGRAQDNVAVYGSGGFTTYDDARSTSQLEHWVEGWGITRVKIKVGESWGRCERRDLERASWARKVIGDEVELFVDANGAYSRKQASRLGRHFMAEADVSWFEEPVSSDDLEGLKEVKEQLVLDVTAGEYGYDETYFERMLASGSVDCLQIDVTRCGGFTSWLRAADLALARGVEVSAHCAPNLHAHIGAAVPHLRHVEYFHDHQKVDSILFEGALDPTGGVLTPDRDRPGHGFALKEIDAQTYRQ